MDASGSHIAGLTFGLFVGFILSIPPLVPPPFSTLNQKRINRIARVVWYICSPLCAFEPSKQVFVNVSAFSGNSEYSRQRTHRTALIPFMHTAYSTQPIVSLFAIPNVRKFFFEFGFSEFHSTTERYLVVQAESYLNEAVTSNLIAVSAVFLTSVI